MIHARDDYQRFQDPAGKIPADEPVMLFRGQDVYAPIALRAYADALERSGGSTELVRMVRNHALKMEAWEPKKKPDLPADMNAELQSLMERIEAEGAALIPPQPGQVPVELKSVDIKPMSNEAWSQQVDEKILAPLKK